ncbi:ankyrin repeat-containing protein NPR4-like [Ziziphus jujuba]|uniref:Ankyrin repeat-containing protein NPR4-like n=1 Tax=Ziziphus jujuba TaxID=326968 RepID=A0ABM3ID78_ZIZJJ|nr:ankyrin repeat-containing protein NPR4-like [Ziziphus jujuba]
MAVKFLLDQAMAFRDLIDLQDNKGNTALHVAATVGDFHILRILTNDSRIDKGATNKDKKTFVDIILSSKELQDTEICNGCGPVEDHGGFGDRIVLPPVDTRKTNKAESKENKKDEIQIEEDETGCKQQINEAESKEKKEVEIKVEENEEAGRNQPEKMVMVSSDKKELSKNEGGFENMMNDFTNLNILVATIIATATFAAAFTMPGGYNNQGLPVLHRSKEFKRFLFYDQLALSLSTASLLLHFFLTLLGKIFTATLFPVALTGYLTGFALFTMVFAFDQGIKTVIPRTENHEYLKDVDMITTLIMFIGFYVFVFSSSLLLGNLYATARRFAPPKSVRSRFGLWS